MPLIPHPNSDSFWRRVAAPSTVFVVGTHAQRSAEISMTPYDQCKLPDQVESGINHLRRNDPRMSALIDLVGPPLHLAELPKEAPEGEVTPLGPFWQLVRSVTAQQLAKGASSAIFKKIRTRVQKELPESMDNSDPASEVVDRLTPYAAICLVPVDELKRCGLSTSKERTIRGLSEAFVEGQLNEKWLMSASVDETRRALVAIKGIGNWTVDMFLIFTRHELNIFPLGDLAVRNSMIDFYQCYAREANDSAPLPTDAKKPIKGAKSPKKKKMDPRTQKRVYQILQDIADHHWAPYSSLGSWYMWKHIDMPADVRATLPLSQLRDWIDNKFTQEII